MVQGDEAGVVGGVGKDDFFGQDENAAGAEAVVNALEEGVTHGRVHKLQRKVQHHHRRIFQGHGLNITLDQLHGDVHGRILRQNLPCFGNHGGGIVHGRDAHPRHTRPRHRVPHRQCHRSQRAT